MGSRRKNEVQTVWVLRARRAADCTLDGYVFEEKQRALAWMQQPGAAENYSLEERRARWIAPTDGHWAFEGPTKEENNDG